MAKTVGDFCNNEYFEFRDRVESQGLGSELSKRVLELAEIVKRQDEELENLKDLVWNLIRERDA